MSKQFFKGVLYSDSIVESLEQLKDNVKEEIGCERICLLLLSQNQENQADLYSINMSVEVENRLRWIARETDLFSSVPDGSDFCSISDQKHNRFSESIKSNLEWIGIGSIYVFTVNSGDTSGVLLFCYSSYVQLSQAKMDICLLIRSHMEHLVEKIAFRKQIVKQQVYEPVFNLLRIKDSDTITHSYNVSFFSCLLGLKMGLSRQEIENIKISALLHDIGKVGVPDQILMKPGNLTEEEFVVIRKHPLIGYELLKKFPGMDHILPVVRLHHERIDGRGYPYGLFGHEIPLSVKIVTLADAFVATTPRGKGSFPENHPLSLGVYGLSGNPQAIRYLNGDHHDIIMVIGSSLGELATCNWEPKLVQGKKMIHIDYDRSEFGKNYEPALVIHGDIRMVMDQLLSNMETGIHSLVLSQAAAMRQIHEENWQEEGLSWNARKAIQQIGRSAPSNTRFYVDIGESMTYCLHYLRIRENQHFDIDIDFGSMGSGIAGVIGAKLADPNRPTICITGDGCFFMHGMEVLTAKEYHLPIVFFVINNARLGMVYHGHMLQYQRCLEDFSQTRVNIASMAGALGIRHAQIDGDRQIQEADLDEWLSAQGPVIVEIVVDGNDIPPMGERVKFLQQASKT